MLLHLMDKGGPLMWPLVVLSFLSVAFILERAIFFSGVTLKRRTSYIYRILQRAEQGSLERAERLAMRSRSDFVCRTLLNGLAHRNYSLTQALETQALLELRKMRKNLSILDTVITAAPLLGILGTVIGIIFSFDILGQSGVNDPMAVTSGISQALLTTAFGLIIALVTLLPYNYFQSRCALATEELERYSSTLEIIMQKIPQAGKSKDAW